MSEDLESTVFRIKICGVTRPHDAAVAADAGADAIGLNFYEKSPRCVTREQATEIAAAVAGGPKLIGVFVNASPELIAETAESAGLSAIQLHGDEPPQFVRELPTGMPVVRAMRMGASGFEPALRHLAEAASAGRPLAAVLADAPPTAGAVEYGGTGRTADWTKFAAETEKLGGTPAILAGGLTPGNVAVAIAEACPQGVDTASGVESAPGVKDPDLVRQFVSEAVAALAPR